MSETYDTAAPPPPPSSPPPPNDGWNTDHLKDYRRFRRSASDRKVAGVAGGLARHLDVDPTILRVLFVVLIFFGGSGLLLYGVMWLLVPDERTGRAAISSSDSTRNALLIGALVLAGLVAIGDTWNGYGFPWPLAVAALVVFAVLLSRDSRRDTTPVPPGPAPGPPPGSYGPPQVPVPPGATSQYTAYYPPAATPPAAWAPTTETSSVPPTPPGATPPPQWYPPVPPPPAKPRKRGPLLFGITLALLLMGLGILGLADASGADVVDAAYPALALAIIGAMLVLGSFFGRPGGLVLLGLISSLALGGAAIGNPSYDGDRDLVVSPHDATDLASEYHVPAGRIELDLTEIRNLDDLDGRSIDLSGNVGEIVVDIPRGVAVAYDARIDYGGAIEAPGQHREGWDNVLVGETGPIEPEARVDLDLDLHFGHIELRRR